MFVGFAFERHQQEQHKRINDIAAEDRHVVGQTKRGAYPSQARELGRFNQWLVIEETVKPSQAKRWPRLTEDEAVEKRVREEREHKGPRRTGQGALFVWQEGTSRRFFGSVLLRSGQPHLTPTHLGSLLHTPERTDCHRAWMQKAVAPSSCPLVAPPLVSFCRA